MKNMIYLSTIAGAMFLLPAKASDLESFRHQINFQSPETSSNDQKSTEDTMRNTTAEHGMFTHQIDGSENSNDVDSETEEDVSFVETRERIIADLDKKLLQEAKPKRIRVKERRLNLTDEEFLKLYKYIRNLDPNDQVTTKAQAICKAVNIDSKAKARYVRDMFMKPREVHHNTASK